ncbi:MAG: rRNA maturation RNase YbeY [Ignavibacteriales bacterium]|nr:rRNA maturation RNase YbeY [Ignavibacteriales bacterium]
MPKYLSVSTTNKFKINKKVVHSIVSEINRELNLKFSELEINFVNNETILELNKKYLKHNYNTDVITLTYPEGTFQLNGYIFISYEQAKENSNRFITSLGNEILRLIIHGVLHIAGFKDKEIAEKKIMSNEEDRLVKKLDRYSKTILKNL